MVLHTGLVISSFTIPAGIGAAVLFATNMVVWAILTALLGSVLALVGLALIGIALLLANRRVGRSYTTERIRCEAAA